MMNFEEFKKDIKQNIKKFLPENLADSEVKIVPIVKNNDVVLDGLLIQTEESNMLPAIYLNAYFEEYKDGMDMQNILHAIAEKYRKSCLDVKFDLAAIMDFDKTKDRIICRLINGEGNPQFLKNKPHMQIEDMAVTYHILLDIHMREGNVTTSITDSIMDSYGIDVKELHEIALKNTERLFPPYIISLNKEIEHILSSGLVGEGALGEEIPSNSAHLYADNIYVLSNAIKLHGAATVLNQEVMDQMAVQMGGNFFALPSSVHEMLLFPKTGRWDYKGLESMLQSVNATEVLPEDYLSDHVYEYDAMEHKLFRCDKAKERTVEKEMEKEKAKKEKERVSVKKKLSEWKGKVNEPGLEKAVEKGTKREKMQSDYLQ